MIFKLSVKALAIFRIMLSVCAVCGMVYSFKKTTIRPTGVSHGMCTSCKEEYKKEALRTLGRI